MDEIIYPAPLYNFLSFTNEHAPEKSVLDCGAGGSRPPLALFHSHGYRTNGIDISQSQIRSAREFASSRGIDLGIREADMRSIPFGDESFGCVYSWNSSIHLTKKDTAITVGEMLRVLKPGGLLYMNFIWDIARAVYQGEEREPGELWVTDGDTEYLHSVFSENEPDSLFTGKRILFKQSRKLERIIRSRLIKDGYHDYIVQKT